MAQLNPYLNFMGNTEEAFNFYKSVFGGEFTTISRFKDTPEKDRLPVDEQDKLMHVALKVGNNTLMGTDALKSMGHSVTPGNQITLSLEAESKEEADKLYSALSAGGKAEMPMQDMFWGSYFGMLDDKFGIKWMINFTYKK